MPQSSEWGCFFVTWLSLGNLIYTDPNNNRITRIWKQFDSQYSLIGQTITNDHQYNITSCIEDMYAVVII